MMDLMRVQSGNTGFDYVRAWAALRVIPPGGLPIYDKSKRFPGPFTANWHSGVTLAGAYVNLFAPMVEEGALDPELGLFSAKRFDVSAPT
jgi:glycine/D-amino acid oxidase-like deaminating enzyme